MEKITLEAVEACLKSLEITYELSQAQALVTFCETLLKWNATYNLTTITDASSVLTLHVADSLTLVPKVKEFAPAAKRVLDVGSGGGLPVVPLAVMRPDLSVSAVDTVKKKAVFLRQAGVMCRLRNFTVYNDRVEKLSVPPFDVITSRAFASLKDMLEKSCAAGATAAAGAPRARRHPRHAAAPGADRAGDRGLSADAAAAHRRTDGATRRDDRARPVDPRPASRLRHPRLARGHGGGARRDRSGRSVAAPTYRPLIAHSDRCSRPDETPQWERSIIPVPWRWNRLSNSSLAFRRADLSPAAATTHLARWQKTRRP